MPAEHEAKESWQPIDHDGKLALLYPDGSKLVLGPHDEALEKLAEYMAKVDFGER